MNDIPFLPILSIAIYSGWWYSSISLWKLKVYIIGTSKSGRREEMIGSLFPIGGLIAVLR